MSITKIDSLLIDNPNGKPRSLELWWGDVSSVSGTNGSEFLGVSLVPGSSSFCAASVGGALVAKGLNISTLGLAHNYHPRMPISISNNIPATPGIPYAKLLYFQPAITGMTTGQAAPYQCDYIFRALNCYQKNNPTTVTLPLVSCGKTTGSGQADHITVLRMLFHAACKWGGKSDFNLDQVKIVLHSRDITLINEFAQLKKNYLNLRNAAAYPKMPISYGNPYSFYANNTNSWITANKGAGWPDTISDLQVFGIHMYTTSYFHAMNGNLRQPDPNLPAPGGIGYTNLHNTDLQEVLPLLAVTSAGLLNLKPFTGTTFRGINKGKTTHKFWNPFTVGSTLRILSYMSSSSPMTPVTKNHDAIITGKSVNSRDIHYYSKNPPEKEHLYDYGTEEKVKSAVFTTYPAQISVDEIDHHYCT